MPKKLLAKSWWAIHSCHGSGLSRVRSSIGSFDWWYLARIAQHLRLFSSIMGLMSSIFYFFMISFLGTYSLGLFPSPRSGFWDASQRSTSKMHCWRDKARDHGEHDQEERKGGQDQSRGLWCRRGRAPQRRKRARGRNLRASTFIWKLPITCGILISASIHPYIHIPVARAFHIHPWPRVSLPGLLTSGNDSTLGWRMLGHLDQDIQIFLPSLLRRGLHLPDAHVGKFFVKLFFCLKKHLWLIDSAWSCSLFYRQ